MIETDQLQDLIEDDPKSLRVLDASQLFAQKRESALCIPHSMSLRDEDIGDKPDSEYFKMPNVEMFTAKMKALKLARS